MIIHAALSDTGRKRKVNQDHYAVDAEVGFHLVADGMGGHAAGGRASRLTAETILDFVRLASRTRELTWPFGYDVQRTFEFNVLNTALRLANAKVVQAADEQVGFAGMGSTAVVAWVRDGRVFYSHLGDSRLYLLRGGSLRQLTEDHSLVQEQIKMGMISEEQARDHALRNVVTQAVGVHSKLDIEVEQMDLQDGDRLLLASDGLTDPLNDAALLEILTGEPDLPAACKRLVDSANQAGGRDNITAVLLHYSS